MSLAIWKKYNVSSSQSIGYGDTTTVGSATNSHYTVSTSVSLSGGVISGNTAYSIEGYQMNGYVGSYVTGTYFKGGTGPYYFPWQYARILSASSSSLTVQPCTIVTTYTKGTYISDVTAEQGTYPNDGVNGGYYYVLQQTYAWSKHYLNYSYWLPGGVAASGSNQMYPQAGQAATLFTSYNTIGGACNLYGGESRSEYVWTVGNSSVVGKYVLNGNQLFGVQSVVASDNSNYPSPNYVKVNLITVASGFSNTWPPNTTSVSCGSYIEDVVSTISTQYPQNNRNGSYWYIAKGLTNVPPSISGEANEDLGNKNAPFSISYSVNDIDSANVLNIVEKLNGSQINSISNAPRNIGFTINITKDILDNLPLNQQNTIQISVTDGTSTAYKTITFTRSNGATNITNEDKDLGQVTRDEIIEKYTCHDVEGNTFNIIEKVDDIELKNFAGVGDNEYTINIPENIWFTLINGVHTYTITVTDELGAVSTRIFTFTKKETVIEISGLTNIIPTDIAATKILLTPNWLGKENTDVILFQVCNNAYDVNPTWEDATSQTLLNKSYTFTNKVKTATKWGIDIKFKISLKAGATEEIEFYGLGGAFE